MFAPPHGLQVTLPSPNVGEPLVDDVPGDDVPPRHEIVHSSVSVFQVVRVLPDIAAEDSSSSSVSGRTTDRT